MVFVSTITFSQNNLDEVVYLKNGSVIRGIIIEQIPNQTLKIQTKDGSVFVYSLSEVQKITKEAPYTSPSTNNPIQTIEKPVQNNQVINQNNTELKDTMNSAPKNSYTYNTPTDKKVYLKKGFIGVTEIGSLFAGRNNAAFSFNQLIGKRTSQTFSIGMAFGADINKYVLYVPVTLDTRIYFIKKRVTPFLNLAPGYAMLLTRSRYLNSSEIYHTFITNFGLGVEFKISKSLGVSLNAGGRLTYFPKQNIDDVGGSGFVKFGIVY